MLRFFLLIPSFLLALGIALSGCGSSQKNDDGVVKVGSIPMGEYVVSHVSTGISILYDMDVTEGVSYKVTLHSYGGDADVAVRQTDDVERLENIIVVSISESYNRRGTDEVKFTALATGRYYIEVNGYSNTDYTLIADVLPDEKVGIRHEKDKVEFVGLLPVYDPKAVDVDVYLEENNYGVYAEFSKVLDDGSPWLYMYEEDWGYDRNRLTLRPTDITLEPGVYNKIIRTYRIAADGSEFLYKDLDVEYTVVRADIATSLAAGDEWGFVAEIPQGSDIAVRLVYGPTGMTGKDNVFDWQQGVVPLFGQTTVYSYGLAVEGAGINEFFEGKVEYTDSNASFPVARGYSQKATGAVVVDIDADGENEILTSGKSQLYTIGYKAGGYVQEWVYPYAIEAGFAIKEMIARDMDGDGVDDILMRTNPPLSIRSFGIYSLDYAGTKLEEIVLQHGVGMLSFDVADIDSDGEPEILGMLLDFEGKRFEVYDKSFTTLLYSTNELSTPSFITNSDDTDAFHVANLDLDSDLEVATFGGHIYDPVDGSVRPVNAEFGTNRFSNGVVWSGWITGIASGDFNQDGVEDLLFSSNNDIQIYDTLTDSVVATLPFRAEYAEFFDFDADGLPIDIMASDSTGYIFYQYNSQLGDYSLVSDGVPVLQGMRGMVGGDVDGDGEEEYVFWNNVDTDQVFVVASFGQGVNIEWSGDELQVPTGPFYKPLITDAPAGREVCVIGTHMKNWEAVHHIYKYDYQGGYLTHVAGPVRDFTEQQLVAADIDADGSQEYLIAQDSLAVNESSYVVEVQVNDGSVTRYDIPAEYGDILRIAASDIVPGGKSELILFTRARNPDALSPDVYYLVTYSLDSASVLGVYIYESTPRVNGMYIVDGQGQANEKHVLLTSITLGGSYMSKYSIDTLGVIQKVQAYDIESFTGSDIVVDIELVDIDSVPVFAVLAGGDRIVYLDDGLQLVSAVTLDDVYTSIHYESFGYGSTNNILAVKKDGSSSSLCSVDMSTGRTIWCSPALVGNISKSSIAVADVNADQKPDFVFSTDTYLYITR